MYDAIWKKLVQSEIVSCSVKDTVLDDPDLREAWFDAITKTAMAAVMEYMLKDAKEHDVV